MRIFGLDVSKFEDISDNSDSCAISDITYQLKIIKISNEDSKDSLIWSLSIGARYIGYF